ncbi:MAG: DUF4019 domain-containing protein [Gemmataceae bacterium]|nr:DUF4019 domain-containing protein [Gemmataceae bacterium]
MVEPGNRHLLLVAGAAVVLGMAGLGWFVLVRNRPPGLTAEEGRDIAMAFLATIRTGRVDDAWSRTSAEFKSAMGRDRFRALVRSKPVLKSAANFQACDIKSTNVPPVAECTFRTASGGVVIRVVLSPEQGKWKVGRLAVEWDRLIGKRC